MEEEKTDLRTRHCVPCQGGTPLTDHDADGLLARLDGWEREGGTIGKLFRFKNYYQTIAFVNAVAWMAHRENHHPDLQVGYNTCRVAYTTHAVGGLSENDFICAAKVQALVD